MQSSETEQWGTHEHLLEVLSTIMLQLNALQSLTHDESLDRSALRNGLTAVEQMTRDAIYKMRSTSDNTPLPELVGVTLTEALSRVVEETAETMGLSSRVVFTGEERSLPNYSERLLYRIAQEALYQVQQHTGAHRLRFTFSYGRDDVQLSIEDDGTLTNSEEEAPIPHFREGQHDEMAMARLRPYSDLRQRIEHLGGSLEISSSLEQGTRVLAKIPSLAHIPGPQRSTTSTIVAEPAGEGALENVRVLVVDSQAVSRAGLRHLLESYPGLQVVGEAADGLQAVSETLELGPQVVLMDANLSKGQSLVALKQIKQLNLGTRVLLLSAQDREEYLYETLRAGADGYVLKDIAPEELAQAVRVVASGEVLVQPRLASRLFSRFGKQNRGNYSHETLTAREQEVLHLLARGLRNKEIAARLYVSERTVNFHLANIYQKLNVSGRTEAMSKALEQGLITA